MKRALIVLVALTGCVSGTVQSRYESPFVAYPMDAMLQSREVNDGFTDLIRMGGYGKRAEERAGFVVLDGGHLRLEPWPANNRYHSAEWLGSVPAGTVAIAHTHPQAFPDASPHDRDEAQRLGVPIFVLTPQAVVMVDPRDGHADRIH
jgi:hypothetical protein